jgi:hypothetical protein
MKAGLFLLANPIAVATRTRAARALSGGHSGSGDTTLETRP